MVLGGRIRRVTRDVVLEASVGAPSLPEEVEAAINAVWRREISTHPNLYDGKVYVWRKLHEDTRARVERISGGLVPYRWYLATRRDPQIARSLKLNFMGASGVLFCADGVVIGRRAPTTVDAGMLELVPSGTIGADSVRDGRIDLNGHILNELREEVGLGQADLEGGPVAFAIVEDERSHVTDIGLHMRTVLPAKAVVAIHTTKASHEYDGIAVLTLTECRSTAFTPGAMVPTSALLLDALIRH